MGPVTSGVMSDRDAVPDDGQNPKTRRKNRAVNTAKKIAGSFAAALAFAVCRAMATSHPESAATTAQTPSPAPAGMEQFGPLAYSYDIVGDTFIIHAKGSIGYNEDAAFNAFRKTWANRPVGNVKHYMLSLDSTGGSINGAAMMTEWVKTYHVDTVVPNGATCASACVMIWGAGVHKSVGVKGRIGVHNGSSVSPNDADKDAVANAATVFMTKAIASEGAPPSVVAAAATTEASDLHWLTYDDVVAWKATVIDEDGAPIVASK
jgi:ATP-dependent protease ClpP protease subunit